MCQKKCKRNAKFTFLGIRMLMVVAGEKVKGNVWARLMIGQMGEYINVNQFRSESWENITQTVICFEILKRSSK